MGEPALRYITSLLLFRLLFLITLQHTDTLLLLQDSDIVQLWLNFHMYNTALTPNVSRKPNFCWLWQSNSYFIWPFLYSWTWQQNWQLWSQDTSTGYNIAAKRQPVSGDDPEMNLDPGPEKGPVFECRSQLWIWRNNKQTQAARKSASGTVTHSLVKLTLQGQRSCSLNRHSRPSQRSDSHPNSEDITLHI